MGHIGESADMTLFLCYTTDKPTVLECQEVNSYGV